MSKALNLIIDLPRLALRQATQPLRLAMRQPLDHPASQAELASLVESSLRHEIRAGYTHRFITLMFVTVGDRVFCRRYSYGEPSWHGVFLKAPEGQVKLDKTVVNITAGVPGDMDDIIPGVDRAYAARLKHLGARFLLAGATEPRAQASTLELRLNTAKQA